MRRIRIRKVTVQSFRAFRERQSTPELPPTGLIGLRGFNTDTGGSSGAGKSSVAYAIAYAFDFLPFSATSQQNWHSDLPMQVELELDTPEGPAVLKRGKETSLTWNGETFKGSTKVVNEAIKKMWGDIDPEMIKVLTYRQQRKPGRFLTMKDAERKEFLSLLLGLSQVEAEISEAVKKANLLEAEASKQTAVILALEGQLQEPVKPELDDVAHIEDQIKVLKFAHAEAIGYQLAAIAAMHNAAKEIDGKKPIFIPPRVEAEPLALREAEERLEECAARLEKARALEAAHRQRMTASITKMATVIYALREIVSRRDYIRRSLERIDSDLRALAKSKCQTCGQEWEQADREIDKKEAERRELLEQLQVCTDAEAKLELRNQERDRLIEERDSYRLPAVEGLEQVFAQLQQIRANEQAKVSSAETIAMAQARRIYAEELAAWQQVRDALVAGKKAEADGVVNSVRSLESKIQVLESRLTAGRGAKALYDAAVRSYEALKNRIQVQRAEHAATLQQAAEQADLAAMCKGFLNAVFDEVLAEISEETNEILKAIPNTPTTTVTFVSEVQTAKGTTRQEIRPIVTKNGVVIDLESGVSGGQMESVELAVDLSVGRVIGRRTNVYPGFMIFDESFSAHCLPVKQACMSVLAQAAKDAAIIVVDHSTELQEAFTSFIDVESTNDVSRFKQ